MRDIANYLLSLEGLLIFAFAFFLGVLSAISALPVLGIFTVPKNIRCSDAMSVANTYITLVTLVFVMMTVLITIYTIWFSRWFSRDRSKEIRDNIEIIAHEFSINSDTRKLFIQKLFASEAFDEELRIRISDIVKEQVNNIIKNRVDVDFNLAEGGEDDYKS